MMDHGKDRCVDEIREQAAHAFCRRFVVVGFCAFLRDQDIDEEGPDISNEHTGCSMKPVLELESIQRKPNKETKQQL